MGRRRSQRVCASGPSMLTSARGAPELLRGTATNAEVSAVAAGATGSEELPPGDRGCRNGGGRGPAATTSSTGVAVGAEHGEDSLSRKPDPEPGSMDHHQPGTGRYQVTEVYGEFYPVPPPYSVATSLPTYDEAEKAKAAAMAAAAAETSQRIQEEECPPRDDFSDADQLRVGNDGIFMLAFFMAFIFNWLGFCLSFCITNTIAGRYGAICGFGLSLIKWILIVRFSDYFTGYFNGQYWLWWIFLVLGLLLFFRGFVNYLKVRNMSESMAAAHRTRYFFLL
uniref:Nedd4 family interacting protein 2 n=1 Tax=Nomascus leucogenys TaxID=61853 RepID=G1S382_NOMLE